MSQAIFDIAAEKPQKPHVPDDVQPAGMEKHRGKKWDESLS
jgi:hypothetical protein